jgi:hypothetical protein
MMAAKSPDEGARARVLGGYNCRVRLQLFFVLAAGATACSSSHSATASDSVCVPPTAEACPSAVPSFKTEILPLLEQRCNNCHSPTIDGGPWPLDTQENVKDWATLLVRDLKECTMPPADGGTDFPAPERDKLWAWLICGAPDN